MARKSRSRRNISKNTAKEAPKFATGGIAFSKETPKEVERTYTHPDSIKKEAAEEAPVNSGKGIRIVDVFATYGKECSNCGSAQSLRVVHVKPQSEGGLHIMSNLKVVCADCK